MQCVFHEWWTIDVYSSHELDSGTGRILLYFRRKNFLGGIRIELPMHRGKCAAGCFHWITYAFHSLLPPIVSLNETETRENEQRERRNLVLGKAFSPGEAVAILELQHTLVRRIANVKTCEIIYQLHNVRKLMTILCFRGIRESSRFCVAPLFLFYLVTHPIAVRSRLFANVLNER